MNSLRNIYLRLRKTKFRNHFSYFINNKEREKILKSAMRFVETSKIKGDYLEFGVSVGSTFSYAHQFAKEYKLKNMNFYAFDSFEGLPPVPENEKAASEFKTGMYACNVSNFKKNIKSQGVDLKKVHIIKGWYDKVLNNSLKKKLSLREAAVIYIDCDLYESTVPVLNFITDYLQNGTLIIFDDWFCFKGDPNMGEQKAFNEWLNKNKNISVTEYLKFNEIGNSFIVHKKN